TADCAIGSVAEVARARELGLDVLVTDHHRPGASLPDCPLIHPAISGYPFPDLCAAAVAQKLGEALLAAAGEDPGAAQADADLVALATVADVVPLRGENRRLVREGLVAMSRTRRPGLRALMRVASVDPAAVDERALGFRLAPRINAAGRLARADAALELMLTEDEQRAERVAAFREAFVRHAGSVLPPDDLVPVERVDAVVGPDRLGVAFAEELEKLRPFGHGNPAPTLLVPAARVYEVRGMGEEGEHSRFTIAGGGARARAVAFRVAASSLPESIEDRFDAAVRLELNEWNGAVEPRLVLRALCRTESGACRPIGAARPFSDRLEDALAALGREPVPAGPAVRQVHNRRGEGFAGVAGELISSGARVAIVCADVERRRAGLEDVVGGIVRAVCGADGTVGTEYRCTAPIAWDELAIDPPIGASFQHLVALDP